MVVGLTKYMQDFCRATQDGNIGYWAATSRAYSKIIPFASCSWINMTGASCGACKLTTATSSTFGYTHFKNSNNKEEGSKQPTSSLWKHSFPTFVSIPHIRKVLGISVSLWMAWAGIHSSTFLEYWQKIAGRKLGSKRPKTLNQLLLIFDSPWPVKLYRQRHQSTKENTNITESIVHQILIVFLYFLLDFLWPPTICWGMYQNLITFQFAMSF